MYTCAKFHVYSNINVRELRVDPNDGGGFRVLSHLVFHGEYWNISRSKVKLSNIRSNILTMF